MRYSNAIVVRLPPAIKFDDNKKAMKIDLALARKQQEDLNDTLREARINVIELPPDANEALASTLFADDVAVVIKNTALIGRPAIAKHKNSYVGRKNEVEAPPLMNGKAVVLEGSDVFFTSREIFVGVRKNGTNMEGAQVVAKAFADYTVVPIVLNSPLPLKYHISMATDDILVVSTSKESQAVLKKIERESSYHYRVLTLDREEAVSCINANNHLLFRHDLNDMKFRLLQSPTELWGVAVSELIKIGAPFSRFCLLIPDI